VTDRQKEWEENGRERERKREKEEGREKNEKKGIRDIIKAERIEWLTFTKGL